MFWITWSLAISDEKAILTATAERVMMRVDRATADAQRLFDELSSARLEPCSQAHINTMRRMVFNTRTVEEIGYFENGRLACTSWGVIETVVDFREPDFVTREGLGVTLNVWPALPGGAAKLALNRGSYNVLVDPLRFVDVLTEQQIRMGVAAANGLIVVQSDEAPLALLAQLAHAPQSYPEGDVAFSIVRSNDWTAIALERQPSFFSTLRREQLILLPISLVIAGLIVSVVIWQSRQRLSLHAEITNAIRREEFEVHYQPIVEISSGRCVGAEALVRWRRPDGSWIRPDLFIPVAEETGLVGDITRMVIKHVGTDLGGTLAGDTSLHIAVNLAPQDLKTDAILTSLDALTSSHAIAPNQIWLEVTERGIMDYDAARETIFQARKAGYRLSIDDFGTGYSSLKHLQQIDFDALKIDKSFVDTIGVPSAKSAVIYHIIEMAKALDVAIIGEGIERQEQADYLRGNGVAFAQGWLYSRALPAREFKAYLTATNRSP